MIYEEKIINNENRGKIINNKETEKENNSKESFPDIIREDEEFLPIMQKIFKKQEKKGKKLNNKE